MKKDQDVRISSAHPDVGGEQGKIVKKLITGEYEVKVGRKVYTINRTELSAVKRRKTND